MGIFTELKNANELYNSIKQNNDDNKLLTYFRKYHQYVILNSFIIVVLTSITLFCLFSNKIGVDSSFIIKSPYVPYVANIVFLLMIVFIGLPQFGDKTKLDNIPIENFHLYFFTNDEKTVSISKLRASISCNKFSSYWKISFIILFFMYFYKIIYIFLLNDSTFYKSNPYSNDAFINLFDIVSTVVFAGCVIISTQKTFNIDSDSPKFYMPNIFLVYCLIGLILICIDLLNAFKFNSDVLKIITSIIIGFFGGLIIARFTGILDSKFIRLKGKTIFLFYLYSFIVIFYPILHSLQTIAEKLPNNVLIGLNCNLIKYISIALVILIYLSFFLKFYIAIKVLRIFKTNKMLLYFVRMNRLQDELNFFNNQIKVISK